MGGISGANPYLARTLTDDLVQQAKVAQENEARAERARLDEAELRELEREPNVQAAVTPDRRRGLLDRLRGRSA
jgi:hypothetical protein